MITDDQHYWEDGGPTCHNRFASYEFFHGREGDCGNGRLPAVGEADMRHTHMGCKVAGLSSQTVEPAR